MDGGAPSHGKNVTQYWPVSAGRREERAPHVRPQGMSVARLRREAPTGVDRPPSWGAVLKRIAGRFTPVRGY